MSLAADFLINCTHTCARHHWAGEWGREGGAEGEKMLGGLSNADHLSFSLPAPSPYPQFPGWLLWKLPQPKSWKGKDGLRERETLEASVARGGKERDKLEVDDQPCYIQQVNSSMFPDSCLCRWCKAVYFYEQLIWVLIFDRNCIAADWPCAFVLAVTVAQTHHLM